MTAAPSTSLQKTSGQVFRATLDGKVDALTKAPEMKKAVRWKAGQPIRVFAVDL